ncbi:hypothetical protein ACS8Y6_16160 [Salinisphaera sp. RV14]|uniref:hypothetical protein n=1 Tax=unclassified Salinisphaera TaxID=2649847 RepID=UPI003F866F86
MEFDLMILSRAVFHTRIDCRVDWPAGRTVAAAHGLHLSLADALETFAARLARRAAHAG